VPLATVVPITVARKARANLAERIDRLHVAAVGRLLALAMQRAGGEAAPLVRRAVDARWWWEQRQMPGRIVVEWYEAALRVIEAEEHAVGLGSEGA